MGKGTQGRSKAKKRGGERDGRKERGLIWRGYARKRSRNIDDETMGERRKEKRIEIKRKDPKKRG